MMVWAVLLALTRASVAHVLRELGQVPREVAHGPGRERPQLRQVLSDHVRGRNGTGHGRKTQVPGTRKRKS